MERFTIPQDSAAIAVISHRGRSNFAVQSLAADGSSNELLVNEIGNYSGTRLFDSSAGEHSAAFEITADGSWTITIKHPSKARSWGSGGAALSGTGDDVVIVSPETSGLTVVRLTHAGQSNFAVQSYSGFGRDLVVNEIGSYNGRVTLDAGTFLLAITADGRWTATPE